MKRFIKTTLAIALTAFTTVSFAANSSTTTTTTTNKAAANVSPAERAKIESIVHDYLLSKPEVLVEALQVLQRKQYEQAEQTIKNTQLTAPQFANALFHQPTDPVVGNPKGKVTVVEFFDYQCPHCVDMAPVISAILKSNPDLRIVFKEFPIRGPISNFASRAALAANLQGKYYEFSHAILTAPQPLTQDAIYQIAKAQGLNVDQLKKDMGDTKVNDQLKGNTKLAQDLKLFGTPAFFIGKTDNNSTITYVPGQMNQQQMQDMIDKASK
jgi:protein-disulfide isomerase